MARKQTACDFGPGKNLINSSFAVPQILYRNPKSGLAIPDGGQ
jgi:hypothetical protein